MFVRSTKASGEGRAWRKKKKQQNTNNRKPTHVFESAGFWTGVQNVLALTYFSIF